MKKIFKSLVLAGVLVSLVGCGAESETQKVTVMLDYVANTNHTGMFVALEKGYYEELGLEVEIVESSGTTEIMVAKGMVDIGISYQENLTQAISQSEGMEIKAIATILQHNTSGFSMAKSKNITEVKDFENKTYAGWGGAGEEVVLEVLMEKYGADFDTLDFVMSDGAGIYNLEGDIDIIWTFEAWDNVLAEMSGIELDYLELRELDERLDYYTPVIFTSKEMIENNGDILAKFMEATTKGYEYAIENPVSSAEILFKSTDGYDLEMLIKSQEYLADKYKEGVEVFGEMQDEVWERYTNLMLEYDMIENYVSPSQCYTNEFLWK